MSRRLKHIGWLTLVFVACTLAIRWSTTTIPQTPRVDWHDVSVNGFNAKVTPAKITSALGIPRYHGTELEWSNVTLYEEENEHRLCGNQLKKDGEVLIDAHSIGVDSIEALLGPAEYRRRGELWYRDESSDGPGGHALVILFDDDDSMVDPIVKTVNEVFLVSFGRGSCLKNSKDSSFDQQAFGRILVHLA